jgi:CDP-diacylglycerol--glycerol-3-phosphate 3-phosphatidyltransferase
MHRAVDWIPTSLVALRLVLAPAFIGLGQAHLGLAMLAAILVATLSDILDGIIARRLGVATVTLRRADSIVDLIFWLSVLVGLYLQNPPLIWHARVIIAAILAAEATLQAVSWARFRRMVATHSYSAKCAGLCLMIGTSLLCLQTHPAAATNLIAISYAVCALDVLAILLILPAWKSDVPSFLSALALRRAIRPPPPPPKAGQ